ncbi:S24 family peptidase [Agrobacterium rhizogenes]|nr:S24 family peptidase [Rhizobium rhizogenes]
MLLNEQVTRGLTDREIAEKHNWLQQTFSRWKMGSLPRPHMFASIASFLQISTDMVRELVDEAKQSTGSTKLPKIGVFNTARVYGKVTDRKEGKYAFEAFNQGRKRIPEGRYAIAIDTKVMEPALLVGTKAWIDPAIWPKPGNEVIVHAKAGAAWIGRLVALSGGRADVERGGQMMTIRDVEAVHVIVLSERLAAS